MLAVPSLLGIDDQHIEQQWSDVPLMKAVRPYFEELQRQAEQAGFQLRAASGFRSFQRQLAIWNAKAGGSRPVLDDEGCAIDLNALSPLDAVCAIMRWSALPGASRHHWGTEIDIYDAAALEEGQSLQLTVDETEAGGPFYPMYLWLEGWLQHEDCAFFRPYRDDLGGVAPEPWHLSCGALSLDCERRLTVSALREVLARTDILYKETLLENLEWLFERFVVNTCKPS